LHFAERKITYCNLALDCKVHSLVCRTVSLSPLVANGKSRALPHGFTSPIGNTSPLSPRHNLQCAMASHQPSVERLFCPRMGGCEPARTKERQGQAAGRPSGSEKRGSESLAAAGRVQRARLLAGCLAGDGRVLSSISPALHMRGLADGNSAGVLTAAMHL